MSSKCEDANEVSLPQIPPQKKNMVAYSLSLCHFSLPTDEFPPPSIIRFSFLSSSCIHAFLLSITFDLKKGFPSFLPSFRVHLDIKVLFFSAFQTFPKCNKRRSVRPGCGTLTPMPTRWATSSWSAASAATTRSGSRSSWRTRPTGTLPASR